jgi:hypothetical protein
VDHEIPHNVVSLVLDKTLIGGHLNQEKKLFLKYMILYIIVYTVEPRCNAMVGVHKLTWNKKNGTIL